MKNFLFTFIFLFTLTAPQAQTGEEMLFNEGPVIIEGRIRNHQSNQILFTANELAGSKKYIAKIDSNGDFRFEIDVLSVHDNYITYGGDLIVVFLKPNDSLFIEADGNKFQESISYSGEAAKTNLALNKFFIEFESLMNGWKYLEARRDMKPVEFKLMASDFFQRSRIKADSINNAIRPGSDASSWIDNYLTYREIEDLLQKGMASKEKLPESYYDFEGKLSSVGASAMKCSAYFQDIIEKYHFAHKLQNKNGFRNAITEYNQQTYEGLNTIFTFIEENMAADPNVKNLFLTGLLVRHLNNGGHSTVENFLPVFRTYVKDITCQNYILRLLDKAKSQPAPKIKNLDDLAALRHSGEIFKKLKRKSNGEILYVNIWAPWCGNSRSMMPYFNKIQTNLRNENIRFVHLGAMTSKKEWRKARKGFKVDRNHYLITELQYQELAESLSFYGVPRYLIIDKEGNIVDAQAKRPFSPDLKKELLSLSRI